MGRKNQKGNLQDFTRKIKKMKNKKSKSRKRKNRAICKKSRRYRANLGLSKESIV